MGMEGSGLSVADALALGKTMMACSEVVAPVHGYSSCSSYSHGAVVALALATEEKTLLPRQMCRGALTIRQLSTS